MHTHTHLWQSAQTSVKPQSELREREKDRSVLHISKYQKSNFLVIQVSMQQLVNDYPQTITLNSNHSYLHDFYIFLLYVLNPP